MTKNEFLNALKALSFIDGCRLPELSSNELNEFLRHPEKFFITADDWQQKVIWRELQKDLKASP